MKKYYNIHGLLSMLIEGDEKAIDHLCKQCEYFAVAEEYSAPELEIRLGAFEPFTGNGKPYDIVNRKYYVGEDVIYAEDTYKTAHWKLQISGLDSERTTLYFDGNGWTKYILHKSFVECLIRYKLNRKGCFMVHSSSVAINGDGVVFAASPEAGKTSTMLKYIEHGQSFMSDDFSLIHDGVLYAYPTPITLHSHNLKRHPMLAKCLSAKDKFQIRWRTLVLKMTFGMGDISYKVDIWNKVDSGVAAKVPLKKIVLLTKCGNSDTVETRSMSREEFLGILGIVNYYETKIFYDYMKAYHYCNIQKSEDEFFNRMLTNAEALFTDSTYDEIRIPSKYDSNVFNEIDSTVSRR